jgi:DnaJ like chaperone protein
VARHFGFTAGEYARIRAHHVGTEDDNDESAYAILGVAPDASAGAIHEAYRRLVRESHPDLVIAQGLPPECIALATARVARINAAYDRLIKRGGRPPWLC